LQPLFSKKRQISASLIVCGAGKYAGKERSKYEGRTWSKIGSAMNEVCRKSFLDNNGTIFGLDAQRAPDSIYVKTTHYISLTNALRYCSEYNRKHAQKSKFTDAMPLFSSDPIRKVFGEMQLVEMELSQAGIVDAVFKCMAAAEGAGAEFCDWRQVRKGFTFFPQQKSCVFKTPGGLAPLNHFFGFPGAKLVSLYEFSPKTGVQNVQILTKHGSHLVCGHEATSRSRGKSSKVPSTSKT
jgi:hypothetical protein